ncbi:MAG: type I-B CRISPR-associated protein Cas5b [Candidatus Ratteibacteria bacterium]|jgi:CRISPR-associated protein Cas5h
MEQINKVLVFDIWGDYAHFRKPETTTSPLSYSIPTGTALAGLISAIIGLKRDMYYNFFKPEKVKFAIKILSSIKKDRININLIKTDDGFYLWDIKKNPRFPAPIEFIKNPKYRIYFWIDDEEKYNNLKNFLKEHKSFYTPYLGISEMIANFKFIGEYKPEVILNYNDPIDIHTVINKDKYHIKIEDKKRYIVEKIPLYMNEKRVVIEYANVIFEADGSNLKIIKNNSNVYRVDGDNVVFL